MWAILDMWQNVDILAAILDFETLMSFVYGFEKIYKWITEICYFEYQLSFGMQKKQKTFFSNIFMYSSHGIRTRCIE